MFLNPKPINKRKIKIGDTMWIIEGSSILDFTVGYLGEKSFICVNYSNTTIPEIPYDCCFNSADDAMDFIIAEYRYCCGRVQFEFSKTPRNMGCAGYVEIEYFIEEYFIEK